MARLVSFENAEVRMLFLKRLTLVTVSVLLFHVAAHAQPAGPVATVEVTPSQKEADVGQQVKLTVVAKDASGKVVTKHPRLFRGPFRRGGRGRQRRDQAGCAR